MPAYELTVCRDAEQLAVKAAELIATAAAESIQARGRFTLVLSGGSTPRAAYQLLASGRPQVDWSRTQLFFGDERHVAHGDSRSNYHMAHEALLVPARIAPEAVFAIPTDKPTAAECARAYAATLHACFQQESAKWPTFDLVLLGLGDDGHTASLFPHAAALDVVDVTATSSPPGVLPPPVDRVTLTYPVLNAARHVLFLVGGANKAPALADILSGKVDHHERPAAGVRPTNGRLIWLVDTDAARLLNQEGAA